MNCELEQRYWELANAIVGFSVLQMIAFLSGLANKEFRKHVVRRLSLVLSAIIVSTIFYIVAVSCCYVVEIKLRCTGMDDPIHEVLYSTLWARIIVIGLYGVFGLFTLIMGHRFGWDRE